MGSKPRLRPTASPGLLSPFLADLPGAELSSLFGKPCLKRAGKAFAAEFAGDLVFKLEADPAARDRALAIPGARLWDPSGQQRPMKAWVQVPAGQARHWRALVAVAAAT